MIVCNQVMKFILDKIDKDERQAAKKRKREESVEQKRSKQNASKLSALLFKHKEQLKADILKKRALLDKELQLQVQVRGTGNVETLLLLICTDMREFAFIQDVCRGFSKEIKTFIQQEWIKLIKTDRKDFYYTISTLNKC